LEDAWAVEEEEEEEEEEGGTPRGWIARPCESLKPPTLPLLARRCCCCWRWLGSEARGMGGGCEVGGLRLAGGMTNDAGVCAWLGRKWG